MASSSSGVGMSAAAAAGKLAAASSNSKDEEDEFEGKKGKYSVLVQPSLFPNRPGTCIFSADPSSLTPPIGTTAYELKGEKREVGLYFRIGDATKFNVVKSAFKKAGFGQTSTSIFNVMWTRHPKPPEFEKLNEFQRVNHFPGTWALGRKDNLSRNLVKMRRAHGNDEFDFFPRTYLLPADAKLLLSEYERNPGQTFIVKPNASSCGRGIYLINAASQVPAKKDCLVQQYIAEPYLVDGYKIDLRIYVVVTSFDPLRIYMFDDGLTRFCTEKYQGGSKGLKKRYMHLTNYSVNKKAKKFVWNTDPDADDVGSKWSLKALRRYLDKIGVDHEPLWQKIRDVVIKTIVSVEGIVNAQFHRHVQHRSTCFELFGFDILLDSAMKPWLLEVNIMPSLNSGSPLDKKIKGQLMSDLFHLIGVVPYDRKKHEELEELKKQNRLLGLNRVGGGAASSSSGGVMGSAGAAGPSRRRSVLELQKSPFPSVLTQEERDVLLDTEDEYTRRGNFQRIFPTVQNCDVYSRFFESQRYNNMLLCKWLLEKRSHDLIPSSPSPISSSSSSVPMLSARQSSSAAAASSASPCWIHNGGPHLPNLIRGSANYFHLLGDAIRDPNPGAHSAATTWHVMDPSPIVGVSSRRPSSAARPGSPSSSVSGGSIRPRSPSSPPVSMPSSSSALYTRRASQSGAGPRSSSPISLVPFAPSAPSASFSSSPSHGVRSPRSRSLVSSHQSPQHENFPLSIAPSSSSPSSASAQLYIDPSSPNSSSPSKASRRLFVSVDAGRAIQQQQHSGHQHHIHHHHMSVQDHDDEDDDSVDFRDDDDADDDDEIAAMVNDGTPPPSSSPPSSYAYSQQQYQQQYRQIHSSSPSSSSSAFSSQSPIHGRPAHGLAGLGNAPPSSRTPRGVGVHPSAPSNPVPFSHRHHQVGPSSVLAGAAHDSGLSLRLGMLNLNGSGLSIGAGSSRGPSRDPRTYSNRAADAQEAPAVSIPRPSSASLYRHYDNHSHNPVPAAAAVPRAYDSSKTITAKEYFNRLGTHLPSGSSSGLSSGASRVARPPSASSSRQVR